MKRFILIIFFSAIAISSLFAHDYQAVYSHRICFYADRYGSIKVMRIDSVKFDKDSVMYPLKNIQQLDYNCFTPYGSSMFGSKVLINKSWNTFFNQNNDTIRIKTDAKLNERWTIFSNPAMTVFATVQKIEQLTFMGVTDSVKTIILQTEIPISSVKSVKTNMESAGLFDGQTIQLSKQYGLLKSFNFIYFPFENNFEFYFPNTETQNVLVGVTNPNIGIQNLTWFDVFDFQAGDETHVVYSSTPMLGGLPPNFISKVETITKYLSREDYGDSIKYTIDVVQLTNNSNYIHSVTTDIIKQRNAFNTLPDIPIITNNSMANRYTMFTGEFITKIEPGVYTEIYRKSDNCWDLLIADGCFPTNNYYKGLGGPYFVCQGLMGDYEDRSLVYYKKGSATGGTPLVILGVNQPFENNEITVYPNSAYDKLFIKSTLPIGTFTFELMDVRGVLVLQTNVDNNTNSIDIGRFSQGLYLYRLTNNGKILKSGKIVKM